MILHQLHSTSFLSTAGNVIPDEVFLEGTVRTLNDATRKLMENTIPRVVAHGAEALGAQAEVVYDKGLPPVVGNSEVVTLIEKAAAEELGQEKIVNLPTPSMGSEDFARYLEHVPGAMFRIGTANENPNSHLPLHNSAIFFDEKAIATGAAVFSRLALNCCKKP